MGTTRVRESSSKARTQWDPKAIAEAKEHAESYRGQPRKKFVEVLFPILREHKKDVTEKAVEYIFDNYIRPSVECREDVGGGGKDKAKGKARAARTRRPRAGSAAHDAEQVPSTISLPRAGSPVPSATANEEMIVTLTQESLTIGALQDDAPFASLGTAQSTSIHCNTVDEQPLEADALPDLGHGSLLPAFSTLDDHLSSIFPIDGGARDLLEWPNDTVQHPMTCRSGCLVHVDGPDAFAPAVNLSRCETTSDVTEPSISRDTGNVRPPPTSRRHSRRDVDRGWREGWDGEWPVYERRQDDLHEQPGWGSYSPGRSHKPKVSALKHHPQTCTSHRRQSSMSSRARWSVTGRADTRTSPTRSLLETKRLIDAPFEKMLQNYYRKVGSGHVAPAPVRHMAHRPFSGSLH